MSLAFTRGDILTSDAEAIVIPVNCVGVAGKGLALAAKRKWPDWYSDYRHRCEAGLLRPGSIEVIRLDFWEEVLPRCLISFPTKAHWRNRSNLADVRNGLAALAAKVPLLGVKSLAVPALGCGLGGLKWGAVRPEIKGALGHLSMKVLVYEPEAP
jgi:O-acetyl-ADP-ribose deacetylase (regulator of RNase III)